MFLLKYYKFIKLQNSLFCKFSKGTQKTFSTVVVSNVSSDLNNVENDEPESRIKDKILFNSTIVSKQGKIGYLKERRIEFQKKKLIENAQPLPLSLKFISDNINFDENEQLGLNEDKIDINDGSKGVQFPYINNSEVTGEVNIYNETDEVKYEDIPDRVNNEIRARNENLRQWMNNYVNLKTDIIEDGEINEINYGTPDPKSKISNIPCGGCGAFLHCKDTAVPGYIPSEIFKNSKKLGAEELEAIICQRCFFLKEYNIALQVQVSADDYPKILKIIQNRKALVLLMVDLTDFPCSIWPGIADILGPKTPIFVIGNKVDLLPKDSVNFLTNVKKKLYDHVKISGFGTANIINMALISAKTGYGVENLITSLQKLWQVNDVYIVGCTNVGKSSLFNALLQSDYCKFQVSDLMLRATTSQWPGTTLNLLKFPIMRASHHKIYVRTHRLIETNKRLAAEEERRQELLISQNIPANATLIGRIERSFPRGYDTPTKDDNFSTQTNLNATSIKMGLKENHPDFKSSRWCYDTPGVVHPDQILDLLTLDELISTLPKELIRPETFCIKPGTSLFIAGLARLDYIYGPDSIRLTVFRSNDLPVTICNIEVAEKVYNDCLGSVLFKVPMAGSDRLKKWPGLQSGKQFVITSSDKKISSKDIVLSNAGWIAVNCSVNKEYIFQAWTPLKRGIHVRDCILPKAVKLRGKRIKNCVAYEPHRFI